MKTNIIILTAFGVFAAFFLTGCIIVNVEHDSAPSNKSSSSTNSMTMCGTNSMGMSATNSAK
jgi:hypothetical protein